MVIFTISCCHGNSLGYAHMNKKINPWSVANLHCECQGLKPKVQSNSSFLVVRIFLDVDTVNTVGSHLKGAEHSFQVPMPNTPLL